MSTNPETTNPENSIFTPDSLATQLTNIFSYLSNNRGDNKKYAQGLLDLRNLDQEILKLGPAKLEKIYHKLQEKIGNLYEEENNNVKANLTRLEEDTSEEVKSIPKRSQDEAKKFPFPPSSEIVLNEFTERHLPVAIIQTEDNISNAFYNTNRKLFSQKESFLSQTLDLGAALGHITTLQYQQFESQSQPNP